MLFGHQPWVYVGPDTSVGEAKLYRLNKLDILLASLSWVFSDRSPECSGILEIKRWGVFEGVRYRG